ncbi:MAG TPA: TIM barrel protein [Opitutaceae bacterium]|nr:TIM barrel protein [Opitutaceae bacterium]
MSLLILRSLWTNGFDLEAALADCAGGAYDGVEGPVPAPAAERRGFAARLRAAGVPFVAEIATGGGYVPADSSPERHLEDFRRQAGAAAECGPLFATVLAGCDRWEAGLSLDFFGRLLEAAREAGVAASVETHRSRPTYSPWATRGLLEGLPALRLTCDFSHWCCVCERLVLDGEPALLALCAGRARHVHARVGYAQGPQVPDPRAPEHREALEAHERWWDALWAARPAGGPATLTPEFGPDGYLQAQPFTGLPAGDLGEINRWMAERQRRRWRERAQG